jgi:AcrR family transcriptional regulator
MEATRDRIVEAAIELSSERGISALTMRQVRLRADVAPGTLRNHFSSRDDLERAMVERLTAEAPLPDRSIYDGATTLEDRLERIIRATGRFLDQAARLYRMWLREPMVGPIWAEVGSRYGARWDELWRVALGPLARDEAAMTILRATGEMAFFGDVRAGRRTADEASALIAELIVPWFGARLARLRSTGQIGSN